MAAGLTIEQDRLCAFRAFVSERLEPEIARATNVRSLLLDLALAPGGMTAQLAHDLERAGPYGVGWPGPRIAVGPVRIIKCDVVGSDHLRLIACGDDGGRIKTIGFGMAETTIGRQLLLGRKDQKLWLAGRLKLDEWGARPAAELHLEDAAWA